MLGYRFTSRAKRDLAAARDWYDRRDILLGNRLVDAIVLAIHAAREMPTSFPEVRRGVRAVRCKEFPYRIYFDVTAKYIEILTIYHTARDPNLWDDDQRV